MFTKNNEYVNDCGVGWVVGANNICTSCGVTSQFAHNTAYMSSCPSNKKMNAHAASCGDCPSNKDI